MKSSKIKVLVVDDSRIFRSGVEECLASEADMEVIGSVRNGVKALEFIRSNRPDLITLDVEMPEMDGLETLNAIQEINSSNQDFRPIGVIMLSGLTQKGADITIKALESGAYDFVTKPVSNHPEESLEILRRQLTVKIRSYASQRITFPSKAAARPVSPIPTPSLAASTTGFNAILIGISTGGPRALVDFLPALCEMVDLPILIVQHMPPTFTESLATSLDHVCSHTVIEAKDAQKVVDRCVYIAPGGRHMLLRKTGNDVQTVLNEQPPENGCRPSVNVLFRSAAPLYEKKVIAMILTGMGDDGVKGIAALKRAGAYVIAQDEETSVVWGMPGSAVASGNVDLVLPLQEIPKTVAKIMSNGNRR